MVQDLLQEFKEENEKGRKEREDHSEHILRKFKEGKFWGPG